MSTDSPARDAFLKSIDELIDKAAAECTPQEFRRRINASIAIMDRAIARGRKSAKIVQCQAAEGPDATQCIRSSVVGEMFCREHLEELD
jgi:hypothetical protein